MKKTIIAFILLLNTIIFAQKTPDEIVEQFFIEFKEEGSSKALDNLYKQNKWISKSGDAVIQLKNQIESLNEDYVGEYYGYELILEKKLGDSYILKSYIVKYDRQPIRFTFQFYKPNKEWRIHSFKYDGNIDNEIEEAAKLYYFKLD